MPNRPDYPADTSPTLPKNLTPEQRVAVWCDLMDACEAFLLAGLRRKIGPEGDLRAAYREWYARAMEEHDEAMFRMLERLNQGGDSRAL